MRVRPSYTSEFRADAVALVRRSDRSYQQIAHDLGISKVTLREWYKRDTMAKKSAKGRKAVGVPRNLVPEEALKGESAEERIARLERENVGLRKEVDSLRMDREILKKAAAFFVKESE